MKKTMLIFLCLILQIELSWSATISIRQQWLRGDVVEDCSKSPVIYVLLLPGAEANTGEKGKIFPLVFTTFDSQYMEDVISGSVKAGEIKTGDTIRYEAQPTELRQPSQAQMEGLKAVCKKLGIKLEIAGTA
jgi:hypothetical protein